VNMQSIIQEIVWFVFWIVMFGSAGVETRALRRGERTPLNKKRVFALVWITMMAVGSILGFLRFYTTLFPLVTPGSDPFSRDLFAILMSILTPFLAWNVGVRIQKEILMLVGIAVAAIVVVLAITAWSF